MNIIWHQTASIEIDSNNCRLLFDPFVPLNNKAMIKKYVDINNIFITHNHIDHVSSIKEIYKYNKNIKVFGSSIVIKSLKKDNIAIDNLEEVQIHDVFYFNDFKVEALKGRHIVFNLGIVRDTLFKRKIANNFKNFKYIIKENFKYKENKECLGYKITYKDKNILILGSMGLCDTEKYKNIDILIMAYQGRTDLCKQSIRIIDRIHPHTIILDHFDDSFPPISTNVYKDDFIEMIHNKYKNINLIIPVKDKPLNIKNM